MRLSKELAEMRERQEKMETTLRGAAPGASEQPPTRRKMGNGATGLTKPSMGDGAPTTPKASSSRTAARTSRTM